MQRYWLGSALHQSGPLLAVSFLVATTEKQFFAEVGHKQDKERIFPASADTNEAEDDEWIRQDNERISNL